MGKSQKKGIAPCSAEFMHLLSEIKSEHHVHCSLSTLVSRKLVHVGSMRPYVSRVSSFKKNHLVRTLEVVRLSSRLLR